MAAKQTTDTTLNGLTATALAADPKLRDQTRKMFDQALMRAQYILDFGTDTERSSLIKAIVPQMMRSLQDEAADANAAAQRAAYDRMRAWCRGDTPDEAPAKKPPRKAPAKKKAT
jgi:hypothetical protein